MVRDKVDRTLVPSGEIPWDLPLRGRLQAVGEALLTHVLQPDAVAFMRVVVATADRMPELARHAVRIGREGGVRCVADAIAGSRDAPPEVRRRAEPVAAKFMDLAFVPHQMRALVGDAPEVLQADAPGRVADAIALLSGSGALRPWE